MMHVCSQNPLHIHHKLNSEHKPEWDVFVDLKVSEVACDLIRRRRLSCPKLVEDTQLRAHKVEKTSILFELVSCQHLIALSAQV